MICMTVRDQGIGISSQQQQMLFQPFKRLEHPTTGNIPGDGLGLYLSRKLVEAMDGKMTLSSSSGVGTSVTCLFPTLSLSSVDNSLEEHIDYVTAHA